MPSDDWVARIVRGRHELGREQSVTSQRVELLDAMARTVSEKGYIATTVADVADRARVPHTTFYEHFQDTESCFLASYDMGVDVLITTVQDGLGSSERAPLDRYEGLLTSYLDLLAAEPAFTRTFFLEVYSAGPRAQQRRLDALDRFTDLLAEIFRPADTDRFTCEAIVGAINSVVTTRIAESKIDQLPALRWPIMDFVGRLVGSGGRAAAPSDGVSVDTPA